MYGMWILISIWLVESDFERMVGKKDEQRDLECTLTVLSVTARYL